MKNIEVVTIKVNARIGSDIGSCIKDCIELSAKERRNIELTHNDKIYKIKINDLIACAVEVKK